MVKQTKTWMMTAALVTRRQMKPSQMDAPKMAGSEMKYLNRSSRLPTNRATPTPPSRVTPMTTRPTLRRWRSDLGLTKGW